MSPSLHTMLTVVQYGLCSAIVLLSLNRFSKRDLTIKIIGFMFLVKCLGILQYIIPDALYFNLHTTPQKIESFSFDFIFITMLYAVVFGKQYYTLFALYILMIFPLSVASVFSNLSFFQDSSLPIISSALLCAYSMIYFYRLYKATPKEPLEDNPMFWISTGILMYYSEFIFMMMLSSVFGESGETGSVIDLLHHTLKITSYSIILIGLLVFRKMNN